MPPWMKPCVERATATTLDDDRWSHEAEYQRPEPPPKSHNGWLILLAVVVILFVLFSF